MNNLDRFPYAYGEQKEQPLLCHNCEQPLTDTESDHYWNSHLHGEGEPYCFECASQIDIYELEVAQPARLRGLLSKLLIAASVVCLVLAGVFSSHAGIFLMVSVGCCNLGILAGVCRWM